MIRNIVAVERDGFNVKTLTVAFEVPDEKFDLLEAIKKASTDYCKTPSGIRTLAEHSISEISSKMSIIHFAKNMASRR